MFLSAAFGPALLQMLYGTYPHNTKNKENLQETDTGTYPTVPTVA